MKERLEMLPKKETGEVNHNAQYLTQRMNTNQRRDVYLIQMCKEWSRVQIQGWIYIQYCEPVLRNRKAGMRYWEPLRCVFSSFGKLPKDFNPDNIS